MKYNKKTFTNLIVLLLVTAFGSTLISCSEPEPEPESSVSEEIAVSEDVVRETVSLSLEEAVSLVQRDQMITEIFLCGSLCHDEAKTSAKQTLVSDLSKYRSFNEITKLLNSTYASNEDKQYFLSYPGTGPLAVSDQDGKTAVFYHPESTYSDFADAKTVAVKDTDFETVKAITAKTLSGKDIELKAAYTGGKWLLEKAICRAYPEEVLPVEGEFSFSGYGSLAEFKGEILVIELFMSDDDSAFDEKSENDYHNTIASAVDFAVAESEKYGNEVNVTYGKTYFKHRNSIENNAMAVDFVFEGTGFGDLQSFAESSFDLSKYDNYFFVVCINKEYDIYRGAYNDTKDTKDYECERIIVGKGFTDKDIYKNMLGLAGNPGFSKGYKKDLYKQYFPNDVIFTSELASSEMSQLTAYACGIIDYLDPLYRVFLEN